MRLKSVELADISRYRGELMGVAMLFIVLFHVGLPRGDMFYGLKRCGNVGVDMFFFLSGVGLWFSWMRNPSLRHFFRNRYLRVYPVWLLVAAAFYVPQYMKGVGYSRSLPDLIANVVFNWSFWRVDDLTFWYVPATMMLYCFAPFYMMLILRHSSYRWLPVLMIVWCVMVQWVRPIHQSVGHIEIFWSRLPIFFLGINMGRYVRRQMRLEGASLPLIVLAFVMTLSTCVYLEQQLHGRFPLFVERMVYIPLTVSGILLLCRLLCHLPEWIRSSLRFVGGLSLEIYLLHAHFVLVYIQPLRLGYWPTFLLVIVATLPLAWLLRRLSQLIVHSLTLTHHSS